ncbi:MAG: PilN domain-containing protein [Gammaproteobacteria bacterium]|nr:PilN domain-containing protein [Gammaproteobacteria bacterium]
MAHINLLPWREARRKEREREFGAIAGGAALLAAVVVLYAHVQIGNMAESQQARNAVLTHEIAELDKAIAEIKTLEAEKSDLLARMDVIQDLQLSRPEVVHLFSELATTLPEGVYYTAIKREGEGITVGGIAQSNARVSTLMRNMESSPWLEKPALDVIETSAQDRVRSPSFILRAHQTPGSQRKAAVSAADTDQQAGKQP